MAIDDFLTDLEAAEHARAISQERAEVADAVRVENSRITLPERARGHYGHIVTAYVQGTPLRGAVTDVAPCWLALNSDRYEATYTTSDLVRRGVVVINWTALEGLSMSHPRHIEEKESPIGRSWNTLFRACAQARTQVVWHTRSGGVYSGVIGAVSKDHIILTARGAHLALCLDGLAMLEPFTSRPEREDYEKSSRIAPAWTASRVSA